MRWREFLLHYLGPGQLTGITLSGWLKLLNENRWRISPTGLVRCNAITTNALTNSIWRRLELSRYEEKVKSVEVPPPLFVLGHWRSGTTWLHQLLTLDPRFAWPNNFQTLFPLTFLAAEASSAKIINYFLPRRRPMDNVEWQMDSPQEDEFAISTTCGKSPYLGLTFPRRLAHYDRYLTLRDIPAVELAEWKAAFLHFLRKLTFKYEKPLILKSPTHTARIKVLLEMFPGAKFVHIHRDPLAVYASSLNMFRMGFEMHGVQRVPCETELVDWIIRQYRTMYDAFFEERSLIPAGNFYELAYEELERGPLHQLRNLYESLDLPEFAVIEPLLQQYLADKAGYRKNSFRPLSDDVRKQLAANWQSCFDEWHYSTEHAPSQIGV